jgi:general secretion pathway protein G
LIEVLIVIVVLGILSAVVIFALGGITKKTAVASCQADGATVANALQAYNTQNAGTADAKANQTNMLNGTSANGGNPYLQSWPANDPHYAFGLSSDGRLIIEVPGPANGAFDASGAAANTYTTLATGKVYAGPTDCSTVS